MLPTCCPQEPEHKIVECPCGSGVGCCIPCDLAGDWPMCEQCWRGMAWQDAKQAFDGKEGFPW